MSNPNDPPLLPEGNDPLLDDFVRRASRCEVDPQAVARLRQVWQEEFAARSRSWAWAPLAAAACLAIVAGTLILWGPGQREGAQEHIAEAPRERPAPRDRQVALNPAAAEASNEQAPDLPASPRLTPYELVVTQAALPHARSTRVERTRSVRRRLIERLPTLQRADQHGLPTIVINPRVTARLHRFVAGAWSAAVLGIPLNELERELGELCGVLRGPRRDAAVQWLSRIASRDSLEVLLWLWSQPAHQDTVAPAIARLADKQSLATCYLQASSTGTRSILAAALVDQLTASDAILVIELVSRAPQSQELLADLRTADRTIIEALFDSLDAESRPLRYAAARVLSRLDRTDVSRRLIERVRLGRRRQEALVALASSREPLAVQFLSQAKQNAVFAAALQSALVQSSTSQPWYGG